MEKYDLYIHIGYPKTGTTYLQKELFPLLNQKSIINYIPFSKISSEIRMIQYQDDFSFDFEGVKKRISNHFMKDKMNVISYEGLTGEVFHKSINAKSIADKIKLMFPYAKTILVIRNQVDMIYSIYKQYVHEGGTLSINNLIDFNNDDHKTFKNFNNNVISLKVFNYLNLIKYYKKEFSDEQVKVILFEKLIHDEDSFIENIFNLKISIKNLKNSEIDISRNKGYGKVQIKIARFLNLFFYSNFNMHALRLPNIYIYKIGRLNVFLLRKFLQSKFSYRFLGNSTIKQELLNKKVQNHFLNDNKTLVKHIDDSDMHLFKKYYL